jgi:hypothetical protein
VRESRRVDHRRVRAAHRKQKNLLTVKPRGISFPATMTAASQRWV